MKKILTVVGARPQFVKAAMVSRAINRLNETSGTALEEIIIHTGQHYDRNMDRIFFDEMSIPEPAANLNVGSGLHGKTTGQMLSGLEAEIMRHNPDLVLVYGDTNSTLAGALAASKLHIPVAHVEAGLRSFNRNMPEEINRVVTDHIADLLFCPTQTAVENLDREGRGNQAIQVGDVMYDAALLFEDLAAQKSSILDNMKLAQGKYALVTVHRPANTDTRESLAAICDALTEIHRTLFPVVFPVHPRTRKMIAQFGLDSALRELHVCDPVGFLDMVQLERNAALILTDSGGIQKEAYFHQTPCITLRDETEWVETVDAGWNTLTGADTPSILAAASDRQPGSPIDAYGDGHASDVIARELLEYIGRATSSTAACK